MPDLVSLLLSYKDSVNNSDTDNAKLKNVTVVKHETPFLDFVINNLLNPQEDKEDNTDNEIWFVNYKENNPEHPLKLAFTKALKSLEKDVIKAYIEQHNITFGEICDSLQIDYTECKKVFNISTSVFDTYLTGEKKMPIEMMTNIACYYDFFRVIDIE